jgi:putative acetyltransferase
MHDIDPARGPIQIERVSSATEEVRMLIQELDHELSQHYSSEQRHGLALEAIFQPHVRFFLATLGESAVGCGGIALFTDFAEIKRMYVRPASRGSGVADAILSRLVAEASACGQSLVRLETGSLQAAAMRFYRRNGFELCDQFEPYSSMPPEAIATSVFMEKRLFGCSPI